MNDLQQQELATWKEWKTTKDPQKLGQLLTSIDPFIQNNINRYAGVPLPRPALESHARVLAIKAFETYDPTKSALNTHVGTHLRHLSRYVLDYQNVGRIPEHRGMQIARYHNAFSGLKDTLGREPSMLEMADHLKWNPAEVERMQAEMRADLNVHQGKEEAFFDTDFHNTDQTKDAVMFVYYSSTPEEQKILEYWFGLGGIPKKSIAEMAFAMNRSESYIRKKSKELAEEVKKALM